MQGSASAARRPGRVWLVGTILATVGLVAACSSNAGTAPPASAAPAASAAAAPSAAASVAPSTAPSAAPAASAAPSAASFSPPNLSGDTIRIAIGAAPQVSDTKVELMSQILSSWGAKTSIINQTGDPAAVRVILAGQAEVGAIAVSTAINSGLMIFGPAQPRLDYDFMGAPALKTMADLPGHIYGTSNVHGLEALMFADLLQKYNISPSSVHVTLAGGASVRVSAMLTHHIDATFVHSEDVSKLTSAGFNILAVMSQVAPDLADSFVGASSSWVQAHPAEAVAVDEAWIQAAQIFNNNKSQWVAAAVKYAGGSSADASTEYDILLKANTFPVAKNVFTSASGQAQETLAGKVGAITSTPPLSKWFDETPWDQACAAMGVQ